MREALRCRQQTRPRRPARSKNGSAGAFSFRLSWSEKRPRFGYRFRPRNGYSFRPLNTKCINGGQKAYPFRGRNLYPKRGRFSDQERWKLKAPALPFLDRADQPWSRLLATPQCSNASRIWKGQVGLADLQPEEKARRFHRGCRPPGGGVRLRM